MAQENKKEESSFEAVRVPTDHTVMIQNPAGEVMSLEQGIALCLNELSEIKKLLG